MVFSACGVAQSGEGASGEGSSGDALSFRWVAPARWNASGTYAVTWDDKVVVKLDVGGAHREVTANGYGGIVDFGTVNGTPMKVDLRAFCGKGDVKCPSEVFSKDIVVAEQTPYSQWSLRELKVTDVATKATVSGYVDHDTERFILGLGGQNGGSGSCGALAVSLAGGRFTHAAGVVAPVGIAEGKVAVGFLGACAFGPAIVGATVTIETGFTAKRR